MTTRRFFLRALSTATVATAVSQAGAFDVTADGNYLGPDLGPETIAKKFTRLAVEDDNATEFLAKKIDGTMKVERYLQRMPELSGVVTQAVASGESPLAQHSVLLVHHLTGEVLGVIAALRKLGCRDVVTVFVGYNPDVEKIYRPDLEGLPAEEFRCYILGTSQESGEPTYFVPRTFIKQPSTESMTTIDLLDGAMKTRHLDFIEAMRALVVQMALAQMARARTTGRRFLVIEDGGYTSPIFNDAALAGLTVAQMRTQYAAPADPATDAVLPGAIKEVVADVMLGSVEHTRNGYDFNMQVNLKYGKLAKPAFSIAVSYLKTQIESDTVAATILNAIESVLYSHGVGLRRRNVLVFGSRGNIGRRLMSQLRTRLDVPDDALIGCDLKVGRADKNTDLPPWQFRPSQSSAGGASEVATYADIDATRVQNLDLILGVTGGPTPGHPVLQVEDVVSWLLNGRRRELYIASGSTKTDEFPEVLAWMNSILRGATAQTPVVTTELGGRRVRVEKQNVIDVLSQRSFGSRYAFSIEQPNGSWRDRAILFLENLMPVNFLFYGEPTEVIDQVLAQLLSSGLVLVLQAGSLPGPRLYAVDFDPEASTRVYGAHAPAAGTRIPLPLPGES
jgi:hypothetical protein